MFSLDGAYATIVQTLKSDASDTEWKSLQSVASGCLPEPLPPAGIASESPGSSTAY